MAGRPPKEPNGIFGNDSGESKQVKRPNDDLDLSSYVYKGNFTGEQFKRYTEMVEGVFKRVVGSRISQIVEAGLPTNVSYDFVGYKVNAVRAFVNPDDENDNRTKLDGFRIIQEAPVRETKATLKSILQLNSQIYNTVGTQQMIYYVLKQYTNA